MPGIDLYKGRRRRCSGLSGSASGTAATILPFDATRVALLISVTSNALRIIVGDINANSIQRVTIPVGVAPFLLDVETYGDLVTGPLQVQAVTNPSGYQIIVVQDTSYNSQTDGSSERQDLYASR